MSTEEMIAVMQASLKPDAQVQYKLKSSRGKEWMIATTPVWDWDDCDYRVKPDPRRVYQAQTPDGVLCGPLWDHKGKILSEYEESKGFTVVTFVEELTTT